MTKKKRIQRREEMKRKCGACLLYRSITRGRKGKETARMLALHKQEGGSEKYIISLEHCIFAKIERKPKEEEFWIGKGGRRSVRT